MLDADIEVGVDVLVCGNIDAYDHAYVHLAVHVVRVHADVQSHVRRSSAKELGCEHPPCAFNGTSSSRAQAVSTYEIRGAKCCNPHVWSVEEH